jgi:hypothetical protein
MRARQSRCDYPRMQQQNANASASGGYRLGKPHPSGDPRRLWAIIAHRRRLHRAARARLLFHIVHQLRRLPCRSSYQPAAHRWVVHMLDGTLREPMVPDRSHRAQLVRRAWTKRRCTTRRRTVRLNFGLSIAIGYARCPSRGSTLACSSVSCAKMRRTGLTFDIGWPGYAHHPSFIRYSPALTGDV